ncbi:pimeloyl-ACP methyl ester carboxylesterase [Tamaricihabitans halophyticus]|uniref:Pimeloyl-ACP methyl ester carboxylesterase n=1 Tax=Tamaricihabitans halophyticus TaxID=1262583 RepID=A0A4R2R5K6_9PSEU|nr:alpha/beta hydrolase [Tamaricihabitans halophyticus]TCP57079.1 pimeloyl-ACP methyl ester carboxylesterase [Tamaricihabitans halophyticus]
MPEIELSAGRIEYQDTGGTGPVIVLLHGLGQNAELWRAVIPELAGFRVLAPTVPYGSHRYSMRPDVPLSPYSVAMLIGEFLKKLELTDVTLVENDGGHAQTLAANRPDRIGRLVVASCEALENYPPGLPGKLIGLAGKIPGGVFLTFQGLRFRAVQRLPIAWGVMTKRGVPRDMARSWLRPVLRQPAIRRDLVRYLRNVRRTAMLTAAEGLRSFPRPALVVWAAEDRMMPVDTGRRLAALLPKGRFAEIPDSYTLIPLDQPVALAAKIRAFLAETA